MLYVHILIFSSRAQCLCSPQRLSQGVHTFKKLFSFNCISAARILKSSVKAWNWLNSKIKTASAMSKSPAWKM